MRLRTSSILLSVALAIPGFAAESPAAAQVKVHIRIDAPDALEVSYELPANCPKLPFQRDDDNYRAIRATWQSRDTCGAASDGVLTHNGAACRPRFRVPASTNKVVGYPGAFPIGEAIYVHTSKYAVTGECGSVSYHFTAPGSVALQGKVHPLRATAEGEAGGDLAALLMPRDQPPSDGLPAYYDPKLSAVAVAQIRQVMEGTIAFYRKAMPDAQFRMPILAAGLASEPGGPNIGGDAADIMRFTFFNWPSQPAPDIQRMMTKLVAHETSHRFQLRDAVEPYPEARLIHEGGGEFLRWVVSVKKGWLTHADAARELDEKLAECMIGVGQRSWGELPGGEVAANYYHYSCGLPAYVYTLAARQGKGSALARINDFYRDLSLGAAPRFDHALECGATRHCQARWLVQLLGKSVPMTIAWDNLLVSNRLAIRAAPTRQQRDAMMKSALVQLVKDDCGGGSSTTPTADGMIVDSLKACKAVRKEAYVTRVEDVPIFGDERALSLVAGACAERAEVKLGMKNGETLAMPCARAYVARSQFYQVDIERVLSRLERE